MSPKWRNFAKSGHTGSAATTSCEQVVVQIMRRRERGGKFGNGAPECEQKQQL